MRLIHFDRAERLIERYGSERAHATRIATGGGTGADAPGPGHGTGLVHLSCLTVAPGGTIGAHPAPGEQLFLVIAGEGWISGPDGARHPIAAGTAVLWSTGEEHGCGSDTGLTALALESERLTVFEPEHP
ncbi:hypothetical protein GCM10009665_15490 [Kitasatospora nipponensis]|uniref:Cupin type-2 domain-containing protein n=1 Tax=Kitasatospora nipponensis TaxID=258049 RepID=A0ABN1VYR6_9ACTN